MELNLLLEDETSMAAVAEWITLHKRFRPLLHGGVSVHADIAEPAVRMEGVVAPDRSEGLFAVSLTERPRTWPIGRLGIPGLADDVLYTVSVIDPSGVTAKADQPVWLRHGTTLDGRSLRVVGLQMPNLDPDRSVLLHVEVAAAG